MRVAIFTESFLPAINGVTHSVMRVLEYLRDEGHQAMVIAPASGGREPSEYAGFPVIPVAAVGLPGYHDVRVSGTTQLRLERLLEDFHPDVLHLAAPIALGHRAALAANWLGIPVVAIYQTDVPSYAARYGFAGAETLLWWRVRQIHSQATMTLAPSTASRTQLLQHHIPRVGLWGRGVDSVRFDPAKRDETWRRRVAPDGERIIGCVGRLAPEKQIGDLAALADLPDTKLVVVGNGPLRDSLESFLPTAHFTGQLTGEDLPRVMASMDLFVHPGELETFGQSIQEAMASGLPVIAPAKGGPIDLVNSSRTGWLYAPGDLASMRRHVRDLLGDDRKRAAFSTEARLSVLDRTWGRLCDDLMGHYREAIAESRSRHRLTA
ncbi:glycosyltransferase family 1 protein [Raineyella sp. LH-20]|uniref:glycosyltransferase family 4 protein n=1 Tax=Raineyella sp. LH-20 TaxID=3081204 RepID=UPI002954D2CF|nr:glycosyltransferase family 1 protein [Raineyella sp. LH-20]WOP18924.1 glycosyltransferase family 1 protein [Raineyella sp. LH-20]